MSIANANMRQRFVAPSIVEEMAPSDWLSMSLPRPAKACYDLFCSSTHIPEWLTIVRSVVVHKRIEDRDIEVAILARLKGATIGYTLRYTYRSEEMWVGWTTPRESAILVAGCAQFAPLSARSCLVTYAIRLDLARGRLPGWSDPGFDRNAASATLCDFRDYVLRVVP